jgi:hypothetical protein
LHGAMEECAPRQDHWQITNEQASGQPGIGRQPTIS